MQFYAAENQNHTEHDPLFDSLLVGELSFLQPSKNRCEGGEQTHRGVFVSHRLICSKIELGAVTYQNHRPLLRLFSLGLQIVYRFLELVAVAPKQAASTSTDRRIRRETRRAHQLIGLISMIQLIGTWIKTVLPMIGSRI